MIAKFHRSAQWAALAAAGACLLVLVVFGRGAVAITALPTPDNMPGSYGLEATKKQAPPKVGATIATPGNGASFTTSPITVTGVCPNGLLVQVYNNGVMVGAVMCKNGSYSIQVSLFAGANELSAIVYDDLGQAGPVSNKVTVNYTDTRFTAFGQLITLTSSYGRRSAAAGSQLDWPLQLSGGAGPYAFSIEWGDGSAAELKSHSIAGLLTVAHVYKKAGIHQMNVKVTDSNGVSAFLQLIAVASGKVEEATTTQTPTNTAAKPSIMWVPTIVTLALLLPAFWLGRLSQLVSLKRKMLKERDSYKN